MLEKWQCVLLDLQEKTFKKDRKYKWDADKNERSIGEKQNRILGISDAQTEKPKQEDAEQGNCRIEHYGRGTQTHNKR